MHEILQEKLKVFGKDQRKKYQYLREYMQLLILKILDEKGYFRNLAFVGGTALRILYDLHRFSEDLDFCLIQKEGFSFESMMQVIQKELSLQNLSIEIALKRERVVLSAFIKFSGLLAELGISSHKDQKVSVKFEIDSNPPPGYQTDFTLLNKEFMIGILHYDLPSLLAGKLHALLFRPYAKGRDYYDLLWFIGKKIKPNFVLLQNAIQQTEGAAPDLDWEKVLSLLHKRFQKIDFKAIQKDIEPFLADSNELRYFEKEYFLQCIK